MPNCVNHVSGIKRKVCVENDINLYNEFKRTLVRTLQWISLRILQILAAGCLST